MSVAFPSGVALSHRFISTISTYSASVENDAYVLWAGYFINSINSEPNFSAISLPLSIEIVSLFHRALFVQL